MWRCFGPLHKDLEGQLDAEFDSTEYTHTCICFVLISNDTLDLQVLVGSIRYVQLSLREAVSDIWEVKIVTGTGNREADWSLQRFGGWSCCGGVYPDKASAGALELSRILLLWSMNLPKFHKTGFYDRHYS